MEALLQDIRYAVRQLIKTPGFTVVAVVTLALGIGANTAVFSLANWVLLRPLPGVRSPARLATVSIVASGPKLGPTQLVTFPNLNDYGQQVSAFSGLAGQMHVGGIALIERNTRQVSVDLVSGNYFDVLGVRMEKGRSFTADELTTATTTPAAVISHAFWTDAFARGDVLGKVFYLNGAAVTIAGVAAAGFNGTERLGDVRVWLPYRAAVGAFGFPPAQVDTRAFQGLGAEMFGRLAPGFSATQAREQVAAATRYLLAMYPAENSTLRNAVVSVHRGLGTPGPELERAGASLRLLLGIALVLLLIASANLTNLLAFRSVQRREEFAVRRALGATGIRLVRLSVVEAVALALAASAVASLFATWLVSTFGRLALPGLPVVEGVQVDGRVLGFGIALALVVGVVVGLVAPLTGRGYDLSIMLKAAAGSRSPGVIRGSLMVVQVGASFTLLVGALLLVSTVRNLRSVDVGFDRSVQVFSLAPETMADLANPEAAKATRARSRALLAALVPRIKAIPGVQEAGLAFQVPFSGGRAWQVQETQMPVRAFVVSSSYFAAMGIPILRGRSFTEEESGETSNHVVAVSRSLARAVFGNADPVGQELTLLPPGTPGAGERFRVIGEVADSRTERLVGPDAGTGLYIPLGISWQGVRVVVRSTLPAPMLDRAVQSAIRELAPERPITEVGSFRQKIDQTISEERLFAKVLTLLTVLALTLAAVGLYGLVAFSVAERRRDMGIRMALGADATQIINLVIRQGANLTWLGVGLGLGGAAVLSHLMANRLFGVAPIEPSIYLLATGLLVLVALAASVIPARAATRVDPMIAIRSE